MLWNHACGNALRQIGAFFVDPFSYATKSSQGYRFTKRFANKSKGIMIITQAITHFKAAWEPNDSNMDFANLALASNSYAHIIFVHVS